MRLTASVSPRFHLRAAALACALLALAGCASKDPLKQAAPSTPAPAEVVQADAAKSAAIANAGAQTTSNSKFQKFLWFFSPYRPDIQQGNFVSAEQLAQLKVGLTKEQVRFVLGTPLLQDIFHADRWDYPFRLQRGNGELTTARVTVYFDKEGKVARFDGGNLPTERDYIARIAGPVRAAEKAPPKKEEPGAVQIQVNSDDVKGRRP
ncbi:outer membrane protein assembly factor BamE [Zemynaea arenosa]|nr:outer membrane protein assembly factor BamE [Massilia arenosa]